MFTASAGRPGPLKVGDAFTLATNRGTDYLRAIERFIGQKIPRLKLEGFSYIESPISTKNHSRRIRRSVRGAAPPSGYSFGPRAGDGR